jgi:hypothetical protein
MRHNANLTLLLLPDRKHDHQRRNGLYRPIARDQDILEKPQRRVGITNRVAGIVAWAKLGEFALTLPKDVHLQIEGELHSREYESDGVKR